MMAKGNTWRKAIEGLYSYVNIRYIRTRRKTPYGCMAWVSKDNVSYVGISYCIPTDRFNKQRGRNIAVGRALKALGVAEGKAIDRGSPFSFAISDEGKNLLVVYFRDRGRWSNATDKIEKEGLKRVLVDKVKMCPPAKMVTNKQDRSITSAFKGAVVKAVPVIPIKDTIDIPDNDNNIVSEELMEEFASATSLTNDEFEDTLALIHAETCSLD